MPPNTYLWIPTGWGFGALVAIAIVAVVVAVIFGFDRQRARTELSAVRQSEAGLWTSVLSSSDDSLEIRETALRVLDALDSGETPESLRAKLALRAALRENTPEKRRFLLSHASQETWADRTIKDFLR